MSSATVLSDKANDGPTPALRGAKRTKQSITQTRKNGLLRGACHRARIRATRWLAMTLRDVAPHSRGAMRPRFANKSRPVKIRGRGEAGRLMHPQPCVQNKK